MYLPKSFEQTDLPTLHNLMEEYNFATLVSQQQGQPIASHLPFLLDRQAGQFGTLKAHMAQANPQWRSFEDGEVLVIFQGPHAYISPSWYEVSPSVPTWNYAIIHAYGRAKPLADAAALHDMMGSLVDRHESGLDQPWSMAGLSEQYTQNMLAAIVAFEIEITRLEGKFKLNQNRSETDQQQVAAELAKGDPLARHTAAMMQPKK